MAREYGGELYDFPNMTDDEVREVVREHLGESPNLDPDDIDVAVKDGRVTLSGRVGTDSEVETATAILDDVLGLDDFSNELMVDALRRGDAPEAADDAVARDREADDGDEVGAQHSDTAAHLAADLEADTFGTRDMGKAIQDGTSYIPPDSPGGDGYGSREDH